MKYRLAFLNGKLKGKRFVIGDGTVTIGRYADCQIDLDDDDEVSRRHAVLETREDGVYIRDLGALNRVSVNGKQVSEARLAHGDTVELGRTQFQFLETHPLITVERRRPGLAYWLALFLVTVVMVGELLYLAYDFGWWIYQQQPERKAVWTRQLEPAPAPVEEEVEEVVEEPEKPGVIAMLEAEAAAARGEEVEPSPAVAPPEAEAAPGEPPATDDAPGPGTVEAPGEEEALGAESPADATAPSEAVPAASASAEVATRDEVASLRGELEGVKSQLEELAAGTGEEAAPSSEPVTEEDPVAARARIMLNAALKKIAAHDLKGADLELQRVQTMAPDYLPAFVERARLFERREMLEEAGAQWAEVAARSVGTPLYDEAAAERIRLGREQKAKELQALQIRKVTHRGGGLPRRIRIESVEREKFQATDEYDEMRLLRITLNPKAAERAIHSEDVRIEVTFFDKEKGGDRTHPTRALVPEDALEVEGAWNASDERTVTAAYIVPKGFRIDEEDEYGERMGYYGYVVRVYYADELQDEQARPQRLLDEMSALESATGASVLPLP